MGVVDRIHCEKTQLYFKAPERYFGQVHGMWTLDFSPVPKTWEFYFQKITVQRKLSQRIHFVLWKDLLEHRSCLLCCFYFQFRPFWAREKLHNAKLSFKKKNKKSISESYNFLYCGGGSLRGVVHSISEKNTQTQKRDCVSSSVFSLLPRNQVFTLAVEAVQTWNAASPWSLMSVFLVIKVAFFSLLSELIRLQSKWPEGNQEN